MEFQPKDKCRKPGEKQETCFPVINTLRDEFSLKD